MQKKYHLCALGNGLVDLQYRISNEVLDLVGIERGEMKLVSSEAQKIALDKLKGVDMHICSGGSAANTLIAFQNFGGKAAYFTSLGNDEFGHFYAKEFNEIGIDLFPYFYEDHPTGTCVVLITPDAERAMHTSLGATAFLQPEHINKQVIIDSEWIYLEGYELTTEGGAKALFKSLEVAKANGVKTALTFSDIFVIDIFKDNVAHIAKQADLIFCNEGEAKTFTGKEDSRTAFEELCSICPHVVMTLGAEGSLIKWDGVEYTIPSYPASPMDTTGAGDMFAAGFLYGIIHGMGPEKAGKLASLSAARIVSQMGARLNEDHRALINQI